MASRTLQVQIIGDPSSFTRATRQVERDTKRMGDNLDRSGKQIHGFARLSSGGFSRVGIAAGGMATAGAAGATLLAKSFVSSASDINESLTKNQVLFGRYARDVLTFSNTSAKSFGISKKAALEYTGVFGNLFRATGSAKDQSAKMSVQLTKLAADMASFNNTSIEDALEAIRSGVVGETEPLRRFGVNLNDAQLRTQALAMGLTHTTKNVLTPHQRALASVALITKQAANAQGDFARTSGGLANQQRILKARISDLGAALGKTLLPAVTKAVSGINDFITRTQAGRGAVGRFVVSLKGLSGGFTDLSRKTGKSSRESSSEFARFGFTIKRVTDATVLPAMQFIGRRVKAMAGVVRDVARGLIALINGDWSQAWRNFQLAAVKNFGQLTRALRSAGAASLRLVVKLGKDIVTGIITGLAGLETKIANKIKGAIKSAAGTVGGWIDKANPFSSITGNIGDGLGKKLGDGIGAGGVLPSGGAFGGSLMGARPAMRPFAAIGSRFGLNVSSGRDGRVGKLTSSGNTSWHSSGEAIDMSGPAGGMMAYAKSLRSKFGGRLAELIYTPMGAGIKNGRPYTYGGQVAADHFDHVHVAFDSGRPGIGDGLGKFQATSYGPPWDAMNGTGVTATGVNLKNAPRRYGVAVDPSVIPLGSKLKISPNPFGYTGLFEAFDTGGAIKGKHIDFYDWRGRSKQLAWGSRNVTISTGSGGGGSHGGGGHSAGRGRGHLVSTVRPAGIVGGGPTTGQAAAQTVADVDLAKATATAHDDLGGLIRALQSERAIKKRRAKHIRRYLRRKRIKPANRRKFTEELTQLVGEIAELNTLLKEYKADARGGATTISGAEALTAGVADSGGGSDAEAGPTATDFANAALAEASLTPGLDDDIAATRGLLDIATGDLAAARASGDPRRISEAIGVWSSVNSSLQDLLGVVNNEAETRQRLIDATESLASEVKTQNEFSRSVAGIATREAVRALADVISGQIVGTNLQGRRLTAGNGIVAITP